MAANRYGRIYHSDHRHINLRFESVDARREFAEKFEKYHAGHDHDGEVPRFEDITAQQAGSTTYESGKLHDAHSVTIDGYATYEIEEYHEDNKHTHYYRYKPPTCCVPPLISIKRKLVDSATLERHELSAIFGDMPDEDYASLLASVEKDGFIDNVIRIYQGQILDGWHRYRAAKELNLIRKLRFSQWHKDEHRDGDPKVFVLGRNLERRHLTPAQRGQIAVRFNERFGIGMNQYSDEGVPLGTPKPKTREELAKEAGVSVRTIARAVEVEKKGESEAVISGKKTAGEVLEPPAVKVEKKNRAQVQAAETQMWEAFKKAGLNEYMDADDLATEVTKVYGFPDLTSLEESDYLPWIARFKTVTNALEKKAGWVRNLIADFEEIKVDERCQDAEEKMWAALDAVAPDWNRDDFAAAACDKHPNWGVETFPVIPDIPAIWEGRFDLLKREIELPADWIQTMLDKMAESSETSEKVYGNGTQGEFNTSENAENPAETQYGESPTGLNSVSKGKEPDAKVTESDAKKTQALEKFQTQKRDLYNRVRETPLAACKDEFGNVVFDKTFHQVMVAGYKHYDLDDGLLYSDQAVEALSADEIGSLTGHYYLMVQDFNPPGAEWVQALYNELEVDAQPDCEDAKVVTAEEASQMEQDYPASLDEAVVSDAEPETGADEGTSKPVNSLEIASEALCLTLETLGIDEEPLFEMLEKAATHYDFNVKHFLYVTDLFPIKELEQAAAYCKTLATPQEQAWAEIIASVQRDIERRENWAKSFFNNDASEETDASNGIIITGVRVFFDEAVEGQVHPNRRSVEFGSSTIAQGTLEDLPPEVKTALVDAVKKL